MTDSAPATIALAMSPEYWRPPSAMTGTPAGLAGQGGLVDRGDLGDADAGDDAGRADRARADADLDRVGAGVDERLGARRGWRRCRRSTWTCRVAGSVLSRWTMSSSRRTWPWAVSATRTSTPASISVVARCQASPK